MKVLHDARAAKCVALCLILAACGDSTGTLAPLSPPQRLVAAADGFHDVTLRWEAPPGGGAVVLYRSAAEGPETEIRGATGTSHRDAGLTSGTRYCYRARTERDGQRSTFSITSCATTVARVVEPGTVQIQARGESALELSWEDRSLAEDEYRVERRRTGAPEPPFQLLATLPAGATGYLDEGLDAFTEYCYRISAHSAAERTASVVRCARTAAPQLGTWSLAPALPTSRQEMNAALLGGEIYVPGGLEGGTAHAVMEVYDPSAQSWRTAAPLPEARHHHGVVVLRGLLYAVGGFRPGGYPWQASADVFRYDPADNTWTAAAPLPAPLGGLAAVVIDDRIYVVGGAEHGTNARSYLFRYDPDTDEWEELRPMPTAREHLAAVALDARLYVIGGRQTHDPTNFPATTHNFATVEVYDPPSNTWQTRAPMPTARGGLFAAALNGRIYAMGGEFPAVFPNVEEYDPLSDTWRQVSPLITARHAAAAVVAAGRIHTIGGGPVFGFGQSSIHEVFTPPAP